MDKSPNIFLLHIIDAIHQIEEYIANYSYEQFVRDKKTQDAVIRQLEIIGEATSNLESAFKNENSSIPWREIADFRNVLAHEYWNVDMDIVWQTTQIDIKILKKALQPLISN